jgi:hypothetical protein
MGALFRALVLVALVVEFSPLVVLVVAVVWAGYVARPVYRQHLASVEQTRRQRAAIVARADEQHQQVLVGDEHGIYGEFPPAVDVTR